MRKKTFLNTPTPKPLKADEIDQFISGGPGRDQDNPQTRNSVNAEVRESANTDMVRLTIDMPRPLHRRYKADCASRGVKMAEEIRAYVERALTPLESDEKRS